MGAFAALPLLTQVAIGTTVASAGLSAVASNNAGKAQEIAYKEQAKSEADAARERELTRKRTLIAALGSQAIHSAAGNISGSSGSKRAVAMSDIRAKDYDTGSDAARTLARQRSLLLQGSSAASSGRLQAFASLADAFGSSYRLLPPPA